MQNLQPRTVKYVFFNNPIFKAYVNVSTPERQGTYVMLSMEAVMGHGMTKSDLSRLVPVSRAWSYLNMLNSLYLWAF